MKGTDTMSDTVYISVAEYAEKTGLSKQAVYKQLNKKLKPFVVVIDGKKKISAAALDLGGFEAFNEVEQPVEPKVETVEQPVETSGFLISQIAEKDRTIESLLRQIEQLQEQNSKLTDLLQNSQVLLAAEKKHLFIEEKTEKKKKGFFGIFKKKETE